jgi:TPR repeat protein
VDLRIHLAVFTYLFVLWAGMGDITALLRLGALLENTTPAALPSSSAINTAASVSPAAPSASFSPSASASTESPPSSDFDSVSQLNSAVACYQRAAALGSAPALVRLGAALQRRGGADNSARAAHAFREAAEAGDPEAMYSLAAGMAVRARARAGIGISSHADGGGGEAPVSAATASAAPSEPSVAELEAEAAMWLRRAADLKYEPAIIKLMLENGVSDVASAAGRFPAVWGLRFDYDPARPAGSRVTQVKVTSPDPSVAEPRRGCVYAYPGIMRGH